MDNASNLPSISCKHIEDFNLTTSIIFTIINLISFVLIIVGNISNLIVLPRLSCLGESTKVYLLTLTIVDLCFGLLAGVASLNTAVSGYTHIWMYGTLFCKISGYSITLLGGLSQLLIVYLSIDRFIAVTWPFRYLRLSTKRHACWSLLLMPIYIFPIYKMTRIHKPLDNIFYDADYGICMIIIGNSDLPLLYVLIFNVSFFLPFTCVWVIYLRLFLIAKKQHARITAALVPTESIFTGPVLRRQPRERQTRGLKATKTVSLITAAFYITWMPFAIINMIAASGHIAGPCHEFKQIAVTLIYSNSWLNVLVYSYSMTEYKHELEQLLHRCKSILGNVAFSSTSTSTIEV